MALFNKILPFLSAILVGVCFEIWLYNPEAIYIIAGALLIIVIGTMWQLTGRKILKKGFWNFLFSPLLFISSGYILFLILESVLIKQFFLVGLVLIFYLMLYNIHAFLYQTGDYQPYAIENIYSYVNLLSAFMFFTSFFGLYLFLRFPYWLATIFAFVVGFLLIFRTLWANKVEWSQGWIFILSGGIFLAESFWVISFVPVSYYVAGFLLTVVYYLTFSFMKDHLLNNLSPVNIKKYMIIGIGLAIIILASSPWY